MDKIVNLIIVFVVITSILKQLREVAGKREELSAPREIPPEALSEQIENPEDVMSSEQFETEPVEEYRPLSREKVTIEEVFKRFAEQVAPVNPVPEPFHEPEKPVVQQAPAFAVEPVQVVKAPVPEKRKKTPAIIPARTSLLNFGAPEVTRGIVMSEILGPPVAMRDEAKW